MHTERARKLPGIFEETVFSPRRGIVSRSVFIKAMHPKTEISPALPSVEKILKAGWIGQTKIHGHRAQIHLSADRNEECIVYNRLGRPHKKLLPEEIAVELHRILDLRTGWTVLDAEWLKPENKLFLFDILKFNDKVLRSLSYKDRYALLPKSYISPFIKTLPLLDTSEKCMKVLKSPEDYIEGLVFKSPLTKGFEDTSIIRCRKRIEK
jgi:ATP-dependent DNA ligase